MPGPPAFGNQDYQAALQRLMPTGRIWRGDQASILTATLGALAPTYTRSTAAALQLLIDANPSTTVNLLSEWEKSLGLPDPCTIPGASVEQRSAAVRAKFGARGSLTTAYFIALAAALGFAITITEFRPFCADDPCDSPVYGPEWSYVWQVNAPTVTTFYFSADLSSADDPLETFDNSELVCRILRDAPAGTVVLFSFGISGNLIDDGGVLTCTGDAGFQIGPAGLGAGAFFSNGDGAGGVVSAVPGATRNFAYPPVYFGDVTAAGLATINAGDLTWVAPVPGSKILWVPLGAAGGDVWVA